MIFRTLYSIFMHELVVKIGLILRFGHDTSTHLTVAGVRPCLCSHRRKRVVEHIVW